MIELYDVRRLLVQREFIVRGHFEFRHVETGLYNLRIATMRGDTVYEEFTNINPTSFPIQIRLPSPRAVARPGGGTVSVGQLLRSAQGSRDAELQKPKPPHVRFWVRVRNVLKRIVGSD